jgi:hypothetical protein
MNARVYDPDIGRFLSPDPTVPYAHNPQSFNRYSYAMNNPLNRVDLDGFADNEAQSQSQGVDYSLTGSSKAPEGADTKGSGTSMSATEPSTSKNKGTNLGFSPELGSRQLGDYAVGWIGGAVDGLNPVNAYKGLKSFLRKR